MAGRITAKLAGYNVLIQNKYEETNLMPQKVLWLLAWLLVILVHDKCNIVMKLATMLIVFPRGYRVWI